MFLTTEEGNARNVAAELAMKKLKKKEEREKG
jgi:hypothetical protein